MTFSDWIRLRRNRGRDRVLSEGINHTDSGRFFQSFDFQWVSKIIGANDLGSTTT